MSNSLADHEKEFPGLPYYGIIELSPEDQLALVEAILNPPEPTPAMKRAFELRKQLMAPKETE